MPSLRTRLAASVTLAIGAHAAGSARADVPARSGDDVARAEARFHAGEQFFDDKQYEAACAAFEESERLDPQLGTLLNLAFCQERMGKTATAWHEYSVGALWAEERGQHDRAAWALGRAVEVGRRVPIVVLQVPLAATGYTIELDGSAVPPSAWGTPLSVDPGEHVVRISARGHRGQQLALRVPEGPVTEGLTIPTLQVGSEMAVAAWIEPALPPEPSRGTSGRLVFGLAGIGLGVAAVGVGSYFGMRTFAKKDDASPHCVGTECDATGVMLQDDAHRSATASTVAFAVGGAALALGTWLALTAHSSGSTSVTARLQPLLGPRNAGFGMGGSW
jgi:hypothetical protein